MSDANLLTAQGALFAAEFEYQKKKQVNRVLSDAYMTALAKIGTVIPNPTQRPPLDSLFWAGRAVRKAACFRLPEHLFHHVVEWHYDQWCGSVEACGGFAPLETAKEIELAEFGNVRHWRPFNKLVEELKESLDIGFFSVEEADDA